ncbi:MAG: hypothetical protein OIF58_15305 [Cohaesibacter sp.]|nr:hypothetical protein [Cohaesibacter sp.]
MSKFATFATNLHEPVANCSEQTANQNTNIAAEVCKVAQKRTSGLTVMQANFDKIPGFSRLFDKISLTVTFSLYITKIL